MPCYNSAPFVADAIDSVLKQSLKDFELIIINDGSTDNTEEVILSFSDHRIRYVRKANSGQSAAANFGLSISNGLYIKFFDADDIMNELHLEKQLESLKGDDIGLSFCSSARFYDDDISTAVFLPEKHWQNLQPLDWIKANMSNLYDMMPGWGWLIPRKVLEKSGGWNESLSLNNDFEFSIRLALCANFIYFAPDARMYYRAGKKYSLSSNESITAFRSAITAAKMGCSLLLQIENIAETRLACANKYSYWLYRLYPHFPDLVKELETEIKTLGGTSRKFDESRFMHLLHRFFGWKFAKRIKLFFYRLGYERYFVKWKKNFFPPSISHR